MPLRLLAAPCRDCGKPTHRHKYCEECAAINKLRLMTEFNEHQRRQKEFYGKEEPLPEKKKIKLPSFTWDEPNHPKFG